MMHCLAVDDAAILLRKSGFLVADSGLLYTDHAVRKMQTRVDGRPPDNTTTLRYFVNDLNRWLPNNKGRVLWMFDWDNNFPSLHEAFIAIRRVAGETRTILQARGHYFAPFPYHEQDQVEISEAQNAETGLLVGLVILLMCAGWSGYLVTEDCEDWIEFWEGNLFFYSHDAEKVAAAEALLTQWQCSRQLR
jgi:hypothetical protein